MINQIRNIRGLQPWGLLVTIAQIPASPLRQSGRIQASGNLLWHGRLGKHGYGRRPPRRLWQKSHLPLVPDRENADFIVRDDESVECYISGVAVRNDQFA
jgi:hypothetical protein